MLHKLRRAISETALADHERALGPSLKKADACLVEVQLQHFFAGRHSAHGVIPPLPHRGRLAGKFDKSTRFRSRFRDRNPAPKSGPRPRNFVKKKTELFPDLGIVCQVLGQAVHTLARMSPNGTFSLVGMLP